MVSCRKRGLIILLIGITSIISDIQSAMASSQSNGVPGRSTVSSLSIGPGNGESTPLLDARKKRKEADPEAPTDATPQYGGTNENDSDYTPNWSAMARSVAPYLRPADVRHCLFAVSALCSVILNKLVSVLPPLAIKRAVDVITANVSGVNDPLRSPIPAILAYFGLKILSMLIGVLQDLSKQVVSLDAERRFGVDCFAHLQSLSLSYHLEKNVGEITRMLNRGTDSLSTILNASLFTLAPTLFEALIVSAVFWKLGTPQIAISTIGAVALYVLFTVLVTNTRVKYRRRLIDANDAVGRKEAETLVNYETVSMFGRSQSEIEQYGALRTEYRDRRVDTIALFQILEFGQKLIRLGGVCLGLVLAGRETLYGDPPLSPGSFVVIQMYIDQLFAPLSFLGWTYRQLTQAFTDLEKVVTMLKRVPEVKDAENAIVWQPKDGTELSGEVVLKDVTFRYKTRSRRRELGSAMDIAPKRKGGRRRWGRHDGDELENGDKEENAPITVGGGIEGTSIRIPAGKSAALVGPSGSGKTTIVRLVLRMYDPDSGTVYVDGHDVRSLTQGSLRSNIGVVAQETVLFNASLRDNVTYGKPDATEEDVWAAVRAAALEDFAKNLPDGLDTLVGERGMKLSGGERQRVGLARCVIKNPRLILLDEATSALDSGTEREIQRNIASICKGRTTLMIAHRLSTARNADEIIVLNKGVICERGTHDELIERDGRYAKMWRDQTEPDDGA